MNIKVTINKPVYGNFVYIRNTYIAQAWKSKVMLEITVPNGTGIMDPIEWVKTGKRMEKVFKKVDEPMILYGNNVIIPEHQYKMSQTSLKKKQKKEKEEIFKAIQQPLFN